MFSSPTRQSCLRLWKSKAVSEVVEEPRVAATEVKVPQVAVKVDQEVVVVKVVVVMAGVAWAVMPFFPMHSGVHHSSMSLR